MSRSQQQETLYAGEEVQVSSTVRGFNAEGPLTDVDVTSVVISIFTSASTTPFLDAAPMTWDSDEEFWFYLWDTTSMSAGHYKARIDVIGLDGKPSIEWRIIRLDEGW